MAITELNLTPNQRESDWVLNGFEDEASEGVDLKEAIPDYRYGIKSITFCSAVSGKWIKIKNGSNTLIGPFALNAFEPFTINYESTIYCDKDNALILQTEENFGIYLCIKGTTGPPIPSKPYNPSPSNGATDVSTTPTMSWSSKYQSVSYNVYIGTNPNELDLVSEEQEGLEYSPTLSDNTTYYWQVDEVLGGNTAEGDTWTFST